MWFLLLLPLLGHAQVTSDVEKVRAFKEQREKNLPVVLDVIEAPTGKYETPVKHVPMSTILNGGFEYGAIGPGKTIYDLNGKVHLVTTEHFFVKYHQIQDEFGYHYLLQEDGTTKYKILGINIESTKLETNLYVPPHRYTPAPTNIVRTEYDSKLVISPEISFYAGIVNGSYMKDLFNDSNAQSGLSNQWGLHLITKWKMPVKTGLAIHYEKSSYDLSNGGQVIYSGYSFGPLFKSKDFLIWESPWRAHLQFRVSPFTKLNAETTNGDIELKFNSADLLIGLEHPIKNRWGEFVIGGFFQSQWLNIKDQPEVVSLRASNETNKTYGISFSQVIE